jgi:virulence-associated protein VagC
MKIQAVDIQNISGQQAIQLPNDLKINDDKVYLKKMGNVTSQQTRELFD